MKIAVVRVRGTVRINHDVRETFRTLGLQQKNHCTILEDAPHVQGMLKVIEPYATWGAVNDETLKALSKNKEKIIRLNPPRKGYGRKGVKMPFAKGGAHGNRGEKINDLLTRMM